MRSKAVALTSLAVWVVGLQAAQFQLTPKLLPQPGAAPPVLQISTTGAAPSPADAARYRDANNWRVSWRAKATDVPTPVRVSTIELDPGTQHLILHLSGDHLPAGDGRSALWTALFVPPADMAVIPTISSFTPRNSSHPAKASFFSVPGSTDTPDVLLNGTFLAGGNTKPIYTLQEQANLYSPGPGEIWGFRPGFTSSVLINQNAQPPNNRTKLDPDSIQAALSFWRVDNINRGILYGLTTKLNPIGGEFTRTDPSSNIISSFLSTFVLRRKKLSELSFVTLYPALGLEAGHNLNHPRQLMGTPVDLSHYSGIFRGVLGSDATFGVASSDKASNVFAITGSYRVRLPATDEPFIETHHGLTTVDLTTRPRHWIEVDITYSPWQWKFLALNAKYQYGSLPPLFSLVDQQVTFGLLLQAKQTRKPALPTQH